MTRAFGVYFCSLVDLLTTFVSLETISAVLSCLVYVCTTVVSTALLTMKLSCWALRSIHFFLLDVFSLPSTLNLREQ